MSCAFRDGATMVYDVPPIITSDVERRKLVGFFRPGTFRAFSRGTGGRRGRSIRMMSRVWAIIIIAVFVLFAVLCSGE